MSRVAVVTGGGSGIGRAVCEHLARDRARVAVLDVDDDAANQVAAEIGGGAIGVGVDVSDRGAVDAAVGQVRSELGPVEILVTSAALTSFAPFEEITDELWRRYMAVNVDGVFHCTQAVIADMVAGGWGRIVTMSSVAGVKGSVNQVHYSATKAAVIGFTKALALEYATAGITANSIPPFAVETPSLHAAQEARHIPPTKYLTMAIPMGRLGTVDEIASMCAYLCSDAAGYVTGQVISPNGGAIT